MTGKGAFARRGMVRSLLFVPGHKADWVRKAIAAEPDAIILDLEDSVSGAAKGRAREAVAQVASTFGAGLPHLFIRVNGWGTGHLVNDVRAAVAHGVAGVVLPKINSVDDVIALDHAISDLERANGVATGSIEIVPLPETARAFRNYEAICASSPRVRLAMGVRALSTGDRGDLDMALGVDAPRAHDDDDTYIDMHLSSCARSAGVSELLSGTVTDVRDLDLLRESLLRGRRLGATGSIVVHPSQVKVAHEVFAPLRAEVERAVALVQAMASGLSSGDAAVMLDGVMVDSAHERSSQAVLVRAKELGLYPDLIAQVPDTAWTVAMAL
jgi:citrate lyase subunit beta/citryl-CoA lyase